MGHASNVIHGGVVAEGAFMDVGEGLGSGFVEGGAEAEHEGGDAEFYEGFESLSDFVRVADEGLFLNFSDGRAIGLGVDAEGGGDAVGVIADEEVHVEGEGDFGGVASGLFAAFMEDFEFASIVCGCAGDVPVPVVGYSGYHWQGELFAGAADEDGWVGFLEGLGLEGGVAELVVASIEVGAVFGPEEAGDADGLFESTDPFGVAGEGDIIGMVLGSVPARADAEDDASAAGVVDGGDGLGEGDGMSEGGAGDEGADPGACDRLGEGGEEGPGVGGHRRLRE